MLNYREKKVFCKKTIVPPSLDLDLFLGDVFAVRSNWVLDSLSPALISAGGRSISRGTRVVLVEVLVGIISCCPGTDDLSLTPFF